MLFGVFILLTVCLSLKSDIKKEPLNFNRNNTIHHDESEPEFELNDFESSFNGAVVFGFVFITIIIIACITGFIIMIYKICCKRNNETNNNVTSTPLINPKDDPYHDAVPPIIPQQPYQQTFTDPYQQPYPQQYIQTYQQQPGMYPNLGSYHQPQNALSNSVY